MKIFTLLLSTFSLLGSTFSTISIAAMPLGQNTTTTGAQQTFTAPNAGQQQTPIVPEKITTQKICSSDNVDNLLPTPQNKISSPFSYLAEQGFTHTEDGSWVCFAKDPRKDGRYYTLFKVQQLNGKLVGSSFLDNGSLIEGQDRRSLDFFMTLIDHHINGTQGNRQSIRRYLESFISLVKQGKIPPSRRGYLFDQPHVGLILYHTLTEGKLKGTAITINVNLS